jgi:hypothetical protein
MEIFVEIVLFRDLKLENFYEKVLPKEVWG